RDIVTTEMIENANRVRGRLLQRLIPGHSGHAEQLDLGARQGEQECDRVVMTRVAIEDDLGHDASTSSISTPVGSESCAPMRDAARAPAAHARLSASAGWRPSSSEPTSA